MKILISGGAGFVGSSLAKSFKKANSAHEIVAFDNLRRRGSERNLPDFKKLGIEFVHGDIRVLSDLEDLGSRKFDLFIDAAAEPSVLAGLSGSPQYVLQTNLSGTLNSLEYARRSCGSFLFLSTSRVYSLAALRGIRLSETPTRFIADAEQNQVGVGPNGVDVDFSVSSARSLYGASKLCSEQVAQEYSDTYKLPVLINRCGVIAGPGQFGKVDQGVFTLWVANHVFGKSLKYTGFGGEGKQVRDLLHPDDLYALLLKQIEGRQAWQGQVYNVGGGTDVSVSMQEMTKLCQDISGKKIEIMSNPETNPVDIPFYVTDNARVEKTYAWHRSKTPIDIVREIYEWIRANEADLRHVFA